MSLNIGSLAFEATGANRVEDCFGILVGSTLSALFGYFLQRALLPGSPAQPQPA